MVRSVWDYTTKLDTFLAWTERLGRHRLLNTPELIRFNGDKRYLVQLDAPTVPTTLLEPATRYRTRSNPSFPVWDIEGERAVVFFGGDFSRAPQADLVVPGTASSEQLQLAWRVHAEISDRFGRPLFARRHGPGPEGSPVLIELEAIEPMLYLDLMPGSAERFAAAVRAA
ncbi:MAG TPA: hypothetical protein VG293_00425 [Solirubrobacteraceae bacterium]|nr:hypothetical protein [Solirubrobacteraceae bacterium]